MKHKFYTLLLVCCAFLLGSCSDDGTTPRPEHVYSYLYAADERDNISESDRLQYAAYGWRLESLSDEEMPQNFRTCQSPFIERETKTGYDAAFVPSRQGLEELQASGSADFSAAGLDGLKAAISLQHDGPVTIVDLRSESHGLVNGIHTSLYGLQNWANIGFSAEQVLAKEYLEMHEVMGKTVEIAEIGSKNNYVPINPINVVVETVQTEEELCQEKGVGYVRFPILDHTFPSDRDIEGFVGFVQTLPADTWLHFHFKAGKGRTTSFMVFYDILRNPDVPLKDIVYRQTNIGGEYVLYEGGDPDEKAWKIPLCEEKAEMIPLFYRYVQETYGNGFAVKWSEWKRLLQ